jgi:signal transduction histidine kinase
MTPDGEYRHVHSEVEVEVDENGRMIRVVGTVQDVTELKAAEIASEQALAAANEASRSKSEFLANMSHELRTPLNAIIGFSELVMIHMAKQEGGEKLIEYLRDIHNSGHHLLGIVNDVLDMSRAEANKFVLNEDAFALAETLDWVVRLVGEAVKQQEIALRVEAERPLPIFMGEERLIRQALLNLVANAIKFTPAGGDVVIRSRAPEDSDITIAISDSGLGMRQEDIPIALMPFGQIDPSLTRKFGGAGLGLPLAKKFIELHGGALTIDSAPEQGTTVTVTLPAARRASG